MLPKLLKYNKTIGLIKAGSFVLTVVFIQFAAAQEINEKIISGVRDYLDANFDRAIYNISQALINESSLLYDDFVDAYTFRGAAYIKKDQREKGIADFIKVLSRNINQPLRPLLRDDVIIRDAWMEAVERVKRQACRYLTIVTEPRDANIYIGDELQTQNIITLQKDKSYEIKVAKPGYETKLISLFLDIDTTITVKLNKEPPSSTRNQIELSKFESIIYRTDIRSYLIGAFSGALLGLMSGYASIYFDNRAYNKIIAYSIEKDPQKSKKLKNEISQNQFWGSFFYYSSYVLTAIGFYAGVRISEPVFQETALFNDKSKIEIYCAVDTDYNPTLIVRRKIW